MGRRKRPSISFTQEVHDHAAHAAALEGSSKSAWVSAAIREKAERDGVDRPPRRRAARQPTPPIRRGPPYEPAADHFTW